MAIHDSERDVFPHDLHKIASATLAAPGASGPLALDGCSPATAVLTAGALGAPTPAPGPIAVPLTSLPVGAEAFLASSELPPPDRQLLRALGLVSHRKLRLCKSGSPWIVQVRGIRIGLAQAVAERLLVRVLEPTAASHERLG